MFTFLPSETRAEVEREYRKRVLSAAFGLIALLMLSGAVLALPSFVVLWVKDNAAKLAAASSRAADSISNTALEAKIKSIRAKTDLLKEMADQKSLISIIDRIEARITPGIIVNGVSLKRSGTRAITLSGTAATRDGLVAFSKSLLGDPSFQNVSLPVSTLAKGRDIGFSISIDSKF